MPLLIPAGIAAVAIPELLSGLGDTVSQTTLLLCSIIALVCAAILAWDARGNARR